MSDTPTGSIFSAFVPAYDPSIAGTPLTPQDTAAKKKPDKIHPCPYSCLDRTGQPRMFTCQHNVRQHVREKHTQERPYRCELCGPSHHGFNRPYTFNRHMLDLHGIHTGPGKGHGTRTVRAKQSSPVDSAPNAQVGDQPTIDLNNYPPQERGLQIEESTNDDFAYAELQCHSCDAKFFNRESTLSHLHLAHGQEPSPLCTCMTCSAIYHYGAGDAEELPRPEEGGFGVVDELQGLLQSPIGLGQNHTLEGYRVPMFAKSGPGLEGVFAEDLFATQAAGDTQKVPSMTNGALIQGNGGIGAFHQSFGLQGDYGFGDVPRYDGDAGFGEMDFGEPSSFGFAEGFGDLNDMDMEDVFTDAANTANLQGQSGILDQQPVYSNSDAHVAQAEDILSRL